MAKKQQTRYAILGALTVFPMSGYDIKKWISDVTGPFWAESPGRIYPLLKQLLQERLVTCDTTKGKGNRPRKLYTIAAKGLKSLQTWLKEPAQPMAIRNELRLKLFYGKNLKLADYLQHIQQQNERMQKELKHYKEIEAHIKSEHKNLFDAKFWLLTLRSAIHHSKAEIAWCEEVERIVKR